MPLPLFRKAHLFSDGSPIITLVEGLTSIKLALRSPVHQILSRQEHYLTPGYQMFKSENVSVIVNNRLRLVYYICCKYSSVCLSHIQSRLNTLFLHNLSHTLNGHTFTCNQLEQPPPRFKLWCIQCGKTKYRSHYAL
jgi:hypothetical protein